MDPDGPLLKAWQAGDRDAGNILVGRYVGEVTWFFRNKVFHDADVSDLVSQTFLGCLDAKGEPAAVRVLLYEIARTTLRQYVARKVKDAREVSDLDNVCLQAIDPQSPGSLARVRRDVRRFIEALREVPLSHQIVLELKYFEGLADHEIAERLDTPESTIRDAIAQGLGRLREQIVAEHRWGVVAPSSVSDADLDKWAAEVRLLRAPGEPS